jgi:methionyl-tRNA synthetase
VVLDQSTVTFQKGWGIYNLCGIRPKHSNISKECESMAHHRNEQCIRQNSTKDPSPSNTPTSYIDKNLEKMHEKVSHFLVQQMDKQLDKMFESTNISVVKFCLIFLVHSLYLPISLHRIAARFFRFASPHLVSL